MPSPPAPKPAPFAPALSVSKDWKGQERPTVPYACVLLWTKPLVVSTCTLGNLLATLSILLVMFRLPSSPTLTPGTVILSPLTRFLPVRSRSSWCHPVTSLPWSTTSASQGHSPQRPRSSLPPVKILASQRHFYRSFTSTMPEMAAKRRLGKCRERCGSFMLQGCTMKPVEHCKANILLSCSERPAILYVCHDD